MKDKKARRAPLDPDDVIAGRTRPDAPALIALIRDVNPTGRGLPARQTAQRYAQKSRLQSQLIRRFQAEIEVRADGDEPGVVSLTHRPSGLDACHAMIRELDEDARSWVQHRIDVEDVEDVEASDPPPQAEPQAAARKAAPRPAALAPAPAAPEASRSLDEVDEGDLDVPALLRAGREAALAYDFDTARARFEAALARSAGAAEPAGALLSLLVDHLGADEDALTLEGRLSAAALRDPEIRVLLALAAARRSLRERALAFLREQGSARGPGQGAARRAELRSARAVDVFAALARAALAADRLDEAANDLAQIRAQSPTHPAIQSLADALAQHRALARGPAEIELCRLFDAGDIPGAERAARELLARFPESDAGRRVASAIAEHRRREQAGQLLASARAALAAGETTRALALLRRALAGGLEGEDAAWAEQRIAAIEEEARLREELARVEEVQRLLDAGNLPRALPAYAALDTPGRQAVRGTAGPSLLLWLDALAPPDQGARAKAAIPAVIALERAASLAARDPRAALDLLGAHAKVLQGFAPAEEVSREARLALTEQRKDAARRTVEAARHALAEDKPDRADESLRTASLADLPDDERTAADDLWAIARRRLKQRALAASIEPLRRAGEELRALSVVAELSALADDTDAARLAELRSTLRADVQRRFCVQVEHLAEGAPPTPDAAPDKDGRTSLRDINISAREVWRTLLLPHAAREDREGENVAANGPMLVIAQTMGDGVFLRLIDVERALVCVRVMLRAPAAMELMSADLVGRHLVLMGQRGALLEIDLDTFHVERWSPNVLRNGDAFVRPTGEEPRGRIGFPDAIVEQTAVAPDGRSLWLNVLGNIRGGTHSLHVLSMAELRLSRELRELQGMRVRIQPVSGLRVPRVAVLQEDNDVLKLLDTRGQPTGESLTGVPLVSASITACPDGEGIFSIASDPAGPQDPFQARWGWIELTGGAPSPVSPVSPMRMFDGVTAVYDMSAVTSLDAGMTFALFEIRHQGCELFGLREGTGGLEIAYRRTIPRRSTLLGDPASRRAVLLIAADDRPLIVPLGAELPALPSDPGSVHFHPPDLPLGGGSAGVIHCHKPTGARLTAVTALANELRREPASTLLRRLDVARHRASAEELLNLEDALVMIHQTRNAGLLGGAAWQRFPKHPRVMVSHARPLMNTGEWGEARALLSRVDPGRLPAGERKHFYHMRGLCSLMRGEPEAALDELKQAERCDEGSCKLDELIALCTPLSDTSTAWTPEQARLRELVALIASADDALARGDAPTARRSLDCQLVWEAYELQSLARLTEAFLREDASDPFRKTFTLLSFCDLFDKRISFSRRELPLPRAAWSTERLSALATEARARAPRQS